MNPNYSSTGWPVGQTILVVRGHCVQGLVLQHFADGQGNALGFGVHVQHLHADDLADLHGVLDLRDTGQRALRDVNQTVKAGLEFDERAERGDADNLALDDAADRILLLGHIPRTGLGLLVAKLDALALRIEGQAP